MNIGQISREVLKYSQKGATLVRKQLGCQLDDFAKEGLRTIKLPTGAKSYDAIRVGRNFNAEKNYTDIFSFRDELGNLVGRYSKKVDGNDVTTTFKTFRDLGYDDVDLLDDIIPLNGKQIRGYTRINDKITECFDETIVKTDTPKPIVTMFKRHFSPEKESIKLSEHQNGKKAKFINNEYNCIKAYRNIFDENYYTRSVLEKSNTSSKELEEIAKHPYFLPYISPRNKFINRVAEPIIDEKNFVIDPSLKTYKKVSTTAGSFYNGTIHVNRINSKGSPPLREKLVNTIGHEAGHGIWDEMATSYDIVKDGFGSFEEFGISPDKLNLVRQYAESIKHYISSGENYNAYRKQFCERMARAEGHKSQKNYEALEKNLREQFQYKHFNQFYPSNKEGYDTMELGDILSELLDYGTIKNLL